MLEVLRKLKSLLIYCYIKTVDTINQELTCAEELVTELAKYDVISFDVFDTLIFRPFKEPTDIFEIIGEKLNSKYFKEKRVRAELKARKMLNKEISIHDIYEIMEEETGIRKETGIDIEFQTEKELCYANTYLMKVFNTLVSMAKDIIIISDMYLPQCLLEEIMIAKGYQGYKKIYISCDYNCSKRDGGLYNLVLKDIGSKSLVHIGDNIISDVISAKKFKIKAKYYKK